jgi:hypothetical protein
LSKVSKYPDMTAELSFISAASRLRSASSDVIA